MSTAVEQVVVGGDLSALQPAQRVEYYRKVCDSLGLNPFTKPFDYITLNGKLQLYARKDATEQLRKLHGVSITRLDGEVMDDLYIVHAEARARDGRIDQAKGAVSLGQLKGEAKANAIMKAETKAKRRVTLSICGLGWTDETEIDSIPTAVYVPVDVTTGEIVASHRQGRAPAPVSQNVSRETFAEDGKGNVNDDDLDAISVDDSEPMAFGVPLAAGAVVWPYDEDALAYMLQHARLSMPELSKKMAHWYMLEDSGSGDKRLSEKQYGLLSGRLDAKYGKGSHRAILSVLCNRVVTGEDAPGWKGKVLIDWLMKEDENAQKIQALDGVAIALRAALQVV